MQFLSAKSDSLRKVTMIRFFECTVLTFSVRIIFFDRKKKRYEFCLRVISTIFLII